MEKKIKEEEMFLTFTDLKTAFDTTDRYENAWIKWKYLGEWESPSKHMRLLVVL